MPVPVRQSWEVRWRPHPDPRLRLFCVPCAGGGAAMYRSWADWLARLAPDIEVIAIRPPGRESRLRERPFTRMSELVDHLVAAVEPLLDRPHAWFGHSMGALVAYEISRRLREAGPVRLCVAGRAAPHLPPRVRAIHDAPVADVVARLRELNGTPEEVLASRHALHSLLPMLRADFASVETYSWRAGPKLACPISVFGGTDDPLAAAGELYAWREHTSGDCTVRLLRGGHFLPDPAQYELVATLAADLADDLDGDHE